MVTQVSTAEAETQPDSKDARTQPEGSTVGHGVDSAKQRQTTGGGGVIDLDKLMHTIDMTRVSFHFMSRRRLLAICY